MLKVLGLFVTMAAASLIGTYYGGLPAQRVRDLEEIKKLLTYMREEVRYASTCLSEVLYIASGRVASPYKEMLLAMCEDMTANEREAFFSIWQRNVRNFLAKTVLDKATIEYIADIGASLGYLDANMQLIEFDRHIDYVSEALEATKQTAKEKGRLFRTLGVLGGILAVIILI